MSSAPLRQPIKAAPPAPWVREAAHMYRLGKADPSIYPLAVIVGTMLCAATYITTHKATQWGSEYKPRGGSKVNHSWAEERQQ